MERTEHIDEEAEAEANRRAMPAPYFDLRQHLVLTDDHDDDREMAVETQTMPALNGHAFSGDANTIKESSLRFASGLILPPPEIKCE